MTNIQLKNSKELARMRRIALGAQGLLQSTPFGRGLSGARKAIAHIGYVQIDTISVVERAHHHVFRARVPNFEPDMTNRLLKDRSVFEYWSHAAAFLPMHDYRYSLPYKHAIKSGKRHWFRSRDKKLMQELLTRIETEGPLRSRDVEEAKGNAAGWWDWKPAKRALEQLYMQGDLMIGARDGFQKTYDLPERVLPTDVDTSMPTDDEFAEHIFDQQLRCHGFVSLKGITYSRRNAELRTAVKASVLARLDAGTLDQIALPSGEQFVCHAGLLDEGTPRVLDKLRILSPFDNAVIQRERLRSIFDYDYQIECYVPEAKRKFGYFCLPLLYRDQFVGRVDCKAHRKQSRLEIKALHFCEHPFDPSAVLAAFADAAIEFAEFQGCDSLTLTAVYPTNLQTPLDAALNIR
jgi:uncharacterized protein YcaQ